MRELERRRLVPDSRTHSRREYRLHLTLDGAPPRVLHELQDLHAAGLRDNASIHVRPRLRGGAPGYTLGTVLTS